MTEQHSDKINPLRLRLKYTQSRKIICNRLPIWGKPQTPDRGETPNKAIFYTMLSGYTSNALANDTTV